MTLFKLNFLASFFRISLTPGKVIQLQIFINAGLVWEIAVVFESLQC